VANKESAKKRVRQNEKRRAHNREIRSTMRTAVKTAQAAIEEKSVDSFPAVISEAQSKLGKAAKRNIIKKNKASRTQSRLMKAANKAKAAK